MERAQECALTRTAESAIDCLHDRPASQCRTVHRPTVSSLGQWPKWDPFDNQDVKIEFHDRHGPAGMVQCLLEPLQKRGTMLTMLAPICKCSTSETKLVVLRRRQLRLRTCIAPLQVHERCDGHNAIERLAITTANDDRGLAHSCM